MAGDESFGGMLRRLRKARDLNQEALAQQVFYATDTIKKLEQGLRRPSRQLAAQLADCLGLSGDERASFLAAARAELREDDLPKPAADLTDQRVRPGVAAVDDTPTNLPVQPTALIGREQEVAQVRALLGRDDTRLLTLTGPGGIGKTRVALQVAAEMLGTFADGVYLVNLAPIRDPQVVPATIATTLGVREGGDLPLLELLKRYVRQKRLLLVLDNFEQVIAAAALIAELLEGAPWLKVLVTSRACLQLYGEREFPVPLLALPDLTRLPPLKRLTQYEAVRLFIERARALKPDFIATDENALAIAEICVRLDGLPLAIELAAVRVKVLAPNALVARLDRRLALLTGGARNLPARQQTLQGAIAWSYELLAPSEQALFAQLAVFVGNYDMEAIEAVCHTDSDGNADLLDNLQSLVNNSLLQQSTVRGESRLSMLETIREYALVQLAMREEVAALRDRHATHYLMVAEAAQPKLDTGEQEIWLNRLEADHDNLCAALAWLLDRQDRSDALRLGSALSPFWQVRGYFTEGRRWLSLALQHSEAVDPALRAVGYTGAGTMAWLLCDYAQALAWHEQALALYRMVDDKQGIAFALNNVGAQLLQQGDYATAKQLFIESVALSRQIRDMPHIAGTLCNVAWLCMQQADFAGAMQYLAESLTISQQLKDTRLIADILHQMGEVARYQNDNQLAVELYNQSLTLKRKLSYSAGMWYTLIALGHIAVRQSNHVQADTLYTQALALCEEHGHREQVAEAFEGLACSAILQGQGARAARLFGAAEQLRDVMNAPRALVENQWYAEAVAQARAALDPATFGGAWIDGRNMPLGEAIAYAMVADAS